MEPSSVNESFHTARSTITSSPSDSNSHSTLHSSSIASTIKPDLRQQQSDMSRNIPSPQSEEPASSRREGLEPRNRVQFFGEAEEANDTTSQITTDTAQPDVTSTVQERDIVFCAIIESKDFTHGPKLQKANKTRKSAQVVEWKEMEVVFTSNELLFNTMSVMDIFMPHELIFSNSSLIIIKILVCNILEDISRKTLPCSSN